MQTNQLDLFNEKVNSKTTPTEVILNSYDHILIMFSGGKDSTSAFLRVLDYGIDKSKIELWHHAVDGEPGSPVFMDWECTEDYCRKFAAAFEVPIYFSWLEGGFEQEMNRSDTAKAETLFQIPFNNTLKEIIELKEHKKITFKYLGDKKSVFVHSGGKGKLNTRLKFPQVTADLRQRWCSAYLKIDVARIAIANQKRFKGKRTLIISGERAEEGSVDKCSKPKGRAAYAFFEQDDTHGAGRHVDRLRIVHKFTEHDVWKIIEKYKVVVHPCYYLGFARCSCKFCIFGNQNQFATAYAISPDNGQKIIDYERKFGVTIKRSESILKLIDRGVPYKGIELYPELVKQAISYEYKLPIFTDNWQLPMGAYGESAGPT